MMATRFTFAQIPFEVMVGNKQTLYFAYIQKDLDSLGSEQRIYLCLDATISAYIYALTETKQTP